MIGSSRPTALVTGGSYGAGYDVARALLTDGYVVVLRARTAEQSWDAAQRLVESGADPTRVHPVASDFAHLNEIVLLTKGLVEPMNRASAPRVLWHHTAITAVPVQRHSAD